MDNKLGKITKVVKEVLEENKTARVDDNVLFVKTINKMYPDEINKTFNEVMMNATANGISFSSIVRARRKIQNEYPALRDEYVFQERHRAVGKYINYNNSTIRTPKKKVTVEVEMS